MCEILTLFFFRKRRKKITLGIKRKIACVDDEYSIICRASDCTKKNYLIVSNSNIESYNKLTKNIRAYQR